MTTTVADAPTAEALVRLGRGTDPQAWATIVERHGPAMYRAALAVVRDEHLAADACQEAFLHVRDGARRFSPRGADPEASARAWLVRVATSSALCLVRGVRRRQRREAPLADEVGAPASEPADDDRRLALALAEAVAELPESLRQPLMLHVYGGLDHAGVASALGLSPGNARVRVHRAVERLRARLARVGAAAALAAAASAAHATPAPALVASWTALAAAPLTPAVPAAAVFGGLTTMTKLSLAAAALAVGASLTLGAIAAPAAEQDKPRAKEQAEEPAGKQVATGVIAKRDGAKISLKEADGETRVYLPHWRGGIPKDGGGLDKDMVRIVDGFKAGDRVKITWEFEEHRRILAIEKVASE